MLAHRTVKCLPRDFGFGSLTVAQVHPMFSSAGDDATMNVADGAESQLKDSAMNFCLTKHSGLWFVLMAVFFVPGQPTAAQSAFSGKVRHFVTSVTPVFGPNGLVGGIFVDAEGVVSRAEFDTTGQLTQIQSRTIGSVPGAARQRSPLRKISLRKLEEELVRLQESELPLTVELGVLAGLQRIEYVFVDPENKDVILAGPAEGWRVGKNGFIVGESSGLPVIDLCDLVMTLRTGRDESETGITCSMDATAEGMETYSRYMRRADPQFNEQTLREMSEAIGNFEVTFTGVASHSHYARTLIAADLMMKRLGMKLEPSPVRRLTSYVEMLQKSTSRSQRNTSPRWWLASNYEPLLRDEEGLVWKLRGPAVKAMTSEDFLNQKGETVDTRNTNRLAQRWAEDFTENFQELSVELPIFGQLRNCMDLAVIAALLNKYELFEKAGFQPAVLTDTDKIQLAEYPVPRFTSPQISYALGRRSWIVTLSGGIDLDGWSIASNTQVDDDLQAIHQQVVDSSGNSWWWD